MRVQPSSDKLDIRAKAALAAAVLIGYLSINVSPLLLGAVKDSMGLTASQAGLLTTLELLGFGFISITVANWIPGWPTRRLIYGFATLVTLSQVVSALSSTLFALGAARLVAGISEGMVIATTYALIARQRQPARIYTRCLAILFSISGVCFLVLPDIVGHFGHRGSYALVAGLTGLAAVFIHKIPPPQTNRATVGGNGAHRPAAVVLTLIAIPVITFSDGMIWPLAERVGVAIGIAPRTIGFILAVSFFSGLSGTWLADHLGDRFGYTRPILAGAWGTATGGLLIATLATVPGYIVGTFAKNVAIFFLMPYLLSAAAAMDPRGRMSAAAGGLIPLGFGTGPIVAGHLIERSGYPILGWTGLCAVAIASLLLIPGFLSLHKLRSSRV